MGEDDSVVSDCCPAPVFLTQDPRFCQALGQTLRVEVHGSHEPNTIVIVLVHGWIPQILGCRLMVGHKALDLVILVRIQASQLYPVSKNLQYFPSEERGIIPRCSRTDKKIDIANLMKRGIKFAGEF